MFNDEQPIKHVVLERNNKIKKAVFIMQFDSDNLN